MGSGELGLGISGRPRLFVCFCSDHFKVIHSSTPHSLLPTSPPPLSLRPLVALNENLAVGGHARFCETEAGFQLQLDSDDLFHALVAEVGVLGREGGFGVDA